MILFIIFIAIALAAFLRHLVVQGIIVLLILAAMISVFGWWGNLYPNDRSEIQGSHSLTMAEQNYHPEIYTGDPDNPK